LTTASVIDVVDVIDDERIHDVSGPEQKKEYKVSK
jgi:hypothetical protein